ncbi:hypothetical protein GCM10009855_08310 [Gordonia cholesterolivorans]|uniref:Uncharacterized protein n=1 Tax=Gordonia cholesterolivorans TaxID=559625 RepID=A0ABN3H8W7_9ACTN
MTASDASAGPYRLSSGAAESSRKASAVSIGSASPIAITARTVSGIRADELDTNIASIDGTYWTTVTFCSRISVDRYSGSRWPSGRAMTRRAPVCRVQKNSHTETSKVIGVLSITASSAVSWYSPCIQHS